jgi:hypothetical protein
MLQAIASVSSFDRYGAWTLSVVPTICEDSGANERNAVGKITAHGNDREWTGRAVPAKVVTKAPSETPRSWAMRAIGVPARTTVGRVS